MRVISFAILAFLISSAEAVHGQSESQRVDGVAERTQRVLRLPWHRDLGSALEASRLSGKPLLWLQMVGDLGDTL